MPAMPDARLLLPPLSETAAAGLPACGWWWAMLPGCRRVCGPHGVVGWIEGSELHHVMVRNLWPRMRTIHHTTSSLCLLLLWRGRNGGGGMLLLLCAAVGADTHAAAVQDETLIPPHLFHSGKRPQLLLWLLWLPCKNDSAAPAVRGGLHQVRLPLPTGRYGCQEGVKQPDGGSDAHKFDSRCDKSSENSARFVAWLGRFSGEKQQCSSVEAY